MVWNIQTAAQLIEASKRTYERKWSFLGLFAFIFLCIVVLLGACGLLPDASSTVAVRDSEVTTSSGIAATSTPLIGKEMPTQIAIAKINLIATIANPTTTDASVLDGYLLKGAVRYPTSAELNEDGNVVLFGHSSYLPIVGNQAYKTFDGIQKLVAGDVVIVYSVDTAYTYVVQTVTKESANDAGIPLAVTGRVLTLVTCNSFAEKTDRFVVTADFVESHPVSIQQ
jgi:LPXTG-site transpeptidase (sortase) family protein